MPFVRAAARPPLASIFVAGGIDMLGNAAPNVQAADKLVAPMVHRSSRLSSTEQLVKLDAAAKSAAGTLITLGRFPRLSATVLASSLVPATLAGHAFWKSPTRPNALSSAPTS